MTNNYLNKIVSTHPNHLNIMTIKILSVLVALLSIASCSPSSTLLQNQALKDIEFIMIDDKKFYISTVYSSQTSKCLENEEQQKRINSNFKKKDDDVEIPTYIADSKGRAILQVPEIYEIVPSRLTTSNLDLQYGICINGDGNVALAKIIYSSQKLRPQEELRIIKNIFKYTLEPKVDQACLECSRFSTYYEVSRK